MKNKKNKKENYLEKIPLRKEGLNWTMDEKGIVTLEVENTGVINRVFQKLFKKPRITYIHLDENGSFVWPLIDGDRNILKIGELVEEHFGDEANPLYERLVKYFAILESYGFISWKV